MKACKGLKWWITKNLKKLLADRNALSVVATRSTAVYAPAVVSDALSNRRAANQTSAKFSPQSGAHCLLVFMTIYRDLTD